jgi:S1-C subfamily serine protease
MRSRLQFGALVVIAILIAGCGGGGITPVPSSNPGSVAPKSTASAVASAYDLANIEASVAYIQTQGTFANADGASEAAYSGSGFVVDSAGGFIVTNNHVVTGGAFWKVAIGASTTLLDAQVVGVSECSDIAVLKVAGKYPALTMASTNPTVGETIYVAGHPNGDPYTLTNGIVAKPAAPADTSWASVQNEIQVTAQTYPGNSGSPVVNAAGQVVAVEYAGGTVGSDIAGESFAIGASEAKTVVDQIIKTGGNLDFIGINGQAASDNSGIFIMSVAPGSPADKAGIEPGDLMTNLNGTAVGADGTKATYCSVLRSHKSSDTLSVSVLRGSKIMTGEINGRALVATGSTATATTQPTAASAGIDQIQAFVPTAIWSTCAKPRSLLGPTVITAVVCNYTGVDAVEYVLYDSAADLKAAYNADVSSAKASPVTGSLTCDNGNVYGTWTYSNGTNGPDQGLLCFESKDSNGQYSTYIEQSDPAANVLFLALDTGDKRPSLYAWWKSNVTVVEP